MPKKALWLVAIGLAGLLYVTWDLGRIPARITLMNQSGSPAHDIVMTTEHARVVIGTLRGGESRVVSIEPAQRLEISYRWEEAPKTWRSIQPVVAGQSLPLAITATGRLKVGVRS